MSSSKKRPRGQEQPVFSSASSVQSNSSFSNSSFTSSNSSGDGGWDEGGGFVDQMMHDASRTIKLLVTGMRYRDEEELRSTEASSNYSAERQYDNDWDSNAVRFLRGEPLTFIGYMRATTAARVAPLLDNGVVRIVSVTYDSNCGGDSKNIFVNVTFSAAHVDKLDRFEIDLTGGSSSIGSSDVADTDDANKKYKPKRHVMDQNRKNSRPVLKGIPTVCPPDVFPVDYKASLQYPSKCTTTPDGSVESLLGSHFYYSRYLGSAADISSSSSSSSSSAGSCCSVDGLPALRAITPAERQQCTSWPPPDYIFLALGLCPPTAEGADEWYAPYGLKNPSLWDVTLPSLIDTRGYVGFPPEDDEPLPRLSTVEKQILGGIYAATHCYSDENDREFDELFGSEDFWSSIGGGSLCKQDQLIAVFGAGYVLGQSASALKFVHGRDHDMLTIRLCRAKSLIYTLTHLMPPQQPFNTIIFGLTFAGPGFGYHRDQCSKLAGKEVTMIPNQPVATTVHYQKKADSGKETVHWIPTSPAEASSVKAFETATFNYPYQALCNLQTFHLTEHIQVSGLQAISKHGVLRTPGAAGAADRLGMRVAATARVSFDDWEQRKADFLKARNSPRYSMEVAAVGDKTIDW